MTAAPADPTPAKRARVTKATKKAASARRIPAKRSEPLLLPTDAEAQTSAEAGTPVEATAPATLPAHSSSPAETSTATPAEARVTGPAETVASTSAPAQASSSAPADVAAEIPAPIEALVAEPGGAVAEDPAPAEAPAMGVAETPMSVEVPAVQPGDVVAPGVEPGHVVTEVPAPPDAPPAVRAAVIERPGHAGELLALSAVETLGPRAGEWARQMRDLYPTADADGLARLATMRSARTSAMTGMLAATTGGYAPLVEYASVAWVQASVVLRVAAAYGADPTSPERAVDLLVLLRLHASPESARAALTNAIGEHGGGLLRAHPLEGIWRLATPLAARFGGWLALRTAARLLPGAALLVAALTDAAATDLLTARAIAHYRHHSRKAGTISKDQKALPDARTNRLPPACGR